MGLIPFKPSVRLRLTAWYASFFLLGGVLLIAATYYINRSNYVNGALVEAEVEKRIGPEQPFPDLVPHVRLSPKELSRIDRASRRRDLVTAKVQHELRAQARRRKAAELASALGLTVLGSLLGGRIVAGRSLRPIMRITESAKRVSETNLSERIALDGPADELKQLGDVFDGMLEHLEQAFIGQRRFVANASHELRTPLASMRTEIDVTLDDPEASASELREMADIVREAIDRAEHLIAGLLTLARTDGQISERRTLDLAALTSKIADRLAGEAAESEISKVSQSSQAAPVHGDPDLLERLVYNLLENAVRYNRRRGWIEIQTSTPAHQAEVEVRNSGSVILPEEVPELFEPFHRLDPSRSRATGGAGPRPLHRQSCCRDPWRER